MERSRFNMIICGKIAPLGDKGFCIIKYFCNLLFTITCWYYRINEWIGQINPRLITKWLTGNGRRVTDIHHSNMNLLSSSSRNLSDESLVFSGCPLDPRGSALGPKPVAAVKIMLLEPSGSNSVAVARSFLRSFALSLSSYNGLSLGTKIRPRPDKFMAGFVWSFEHIMDLWFTRA